MKKMQRTLCALTAVAISFLLASSFPAAAEENSTRKATQEERIAKRAERAEERAARQAERAARRTKRADERAARQAEREAKRAEREAEQAQRAEERAARKEKRENIRSALKALPKEDRRAFAAAYRNADSTAREAMIEQLLGNSSMETLEDAPSAAEIEEIIQEVLEEPGEQL